MNRGSVLRGAEPRKILQDVIEKNTPAIMSYLSGGKRHPVKVLLSNLGANRFDVELLPGKRAHQVSVQVDQPVSVSLKYGYGRFIFETTVVTVGTAVENAAGSVAATPAGTTNGRTIALAVPDWIELVRIRSYFRIEVPESLQVNVLMWHRCGADTRRMDSEEHCCQGRLVDISTGGLRVAIDAEQRPNFRKEQFIALQFTPIPYEAPLMFDAGIRNILPTADGKGICLGLEIVGLQASCEGRAVLLRLWNVVERYYQINLSTIKQQDFQGTPNALLYDWEPLATTSDLIADGGNS